MATVSPPPERFRDEFLSEEDLDLENLSTEELDAYWMLWLEQAQITNELDAALYSHGVFERDPAAAGAAQTHPPAPGSTDDR